MTQKEKIFFLHANGFPSLSYKKLFDFLKDDFDIDFVDQLGHDPEYPVTENWQSLVDEVITSVKSQHNEPIFAVGHSLGGVLAYLAAVKNPELFKKILMFDAPFFGGIKSKLIQLTKKIGWIDRISQAHTAKKRKKHWPDIQHAINNFKNKSIFKNFDPDCLRDYIIYGTKPTLDGIELKFDPEIEYQIFRTLPHHLGSTKNKLSIPVALVHAEQSNLIKAADLKQIYKIIPQLEYYKINAGHMFPFENPKATAELIKYVLINERKEHK